jgi:hypothetical protein
MGFANNNALLNKPATPMMCAIYALSSTDWRNTIHKAFIPEDLVKDSKDVVKSKEFEDDRLAHLKTVMPGVAPTDVVKFAQLDRHSKLETGQLLLPSSITHMFAGECFPLSGPGGAEVQVPSGTMNFPNIAYRNAKYRADWKILSETATTAGCS